MSSAAEPPPEGPRSARFERAAPADPMPEMIDPAFWQTRREAGVVLTLFLLSLVWTLSVCYGWGDLPATGEGESDLSLVWGIPAWAFWGIGFPWLVIDLVAIWFCFVYMQDDESVSGSRKT